MSEEAQDENSSEARSNFRSTNRGAWWTRNRSEIYAPDGEQKLHRGHRVVCTSVNGVDRPYHSPDKDGYCLFCSKHINTGGK